MKQEVIENNLSKKLPCLLFEFKVLFIFFLSLFQTTNSRPTAGKKTLYNWCWIFPFLCGFSWQFCRLVIRGIQILCRISSIILLLQNVIQNLLSQSKLWCATFFCQENIPSWFLDNIYSVSWGWRSLIENISRFSTWLNIQVLVEWSKHCLANWPVDMF